jgi:threonine/homoserine/homoserine lactone efflux protein
MPSVSAALPPLVTDAPIIVVALVVTAKLAELRPLLGLVSFAGGAFILYLAWDSFRPVRVDPEAPLSRPDRGSRVFVYFNRGMAKSYKYEFLDLKPDPAAGVSGSCAVSG